MARRQAEKEQQAAVTIQRCYRRYLARERHKKVKVFRDVHNLHFHYERVRLRAMTQKAPVIARSWQQYRMRKKAEAAKAEQATKRRISRYFTGLVGDVFSTSSKAPPMRANIDRPMGLQLTGKKPRADAPEAQNEKSPLVRTRSRTESTSEAAQRNGSRKLSQKRKEMEEPMTAPVDSKSRPGQRRTVSKRLERIEEIS